MQMTLSAGPRAAAIAAALLIPLAATAQQERPAPAVARSAPVTNIRYELTFDSATAARRTVRVAASYDVTGPGPLLLSFPAWTPGSYEIANFARWATVFTATAGGKALAWDKLDADTWRVQPGGARSITVSFDYLAGTLDNAAAWARPDFAFFNGTNLLPYPEGRGFEFPATVTVKTQQGWLVATGMQTGPAPRSYREGTTTTWWTCRSSSAGWT
jgi:predicted metalloprotease with PDZ domain